MNGTLNESHPLCDFIHFFVCFVKLNRKGLFWAVGDQSLNITIKSIFEMSESKWRAIFVLVIFIRLLVFPPPPPSLSHSLSFIILFTDTRSGLFQALQRNAFVRESLSLNLFLLWQNNGEVKISIRSAENIFNLISS